MFKPTLTLTALEAREVPAASGWVKGGPQPEPPTIIGRSGAVRIDPITLPPAVVGKAAILFPVFVGTGKVGAMPEDPALRPAAGHHAILFPVFAQR